MAVYLAPLFHSLPILFYYSIRPTEINLLTLILFLQSLKSLQANLTDFNILHIKRTANKNTSANYLKGDV